MALTSEQIVARVEAMIRLLIQDLAEGHYQSRHILQFEPTDGVNPRDRDHRLMLFAAFRHLMWPLDPVIEVVAFDDQGPYETTVIATMDMRHPSSSA